MLVQIGSPAPDIQVSQWVQGQPTNLDQLKDNVILLEVFQVNCPGCFLYGIPQALSIYEKYKEKNVKVIGIATAFEDYDKNTLENLKLLINEGTVIGETHKALKQYGKLVNGDKLYYNITFPVAMDKIEKMPNNISEKIISDFISVYFPDYKTFSDKDKNDLHRKVENYLHSKEYSAKTFETYMLRGTPSSVIIDKKGILRYSFFGSEGYIDGAIKELLEEG